MNSVTKPDLGPKGSTPAILLLEKEGISFQIASFTHEVALGDHGYGKAAAMALGVAEERFFKTLMVALRGGHGGDGAKFAATPHFIYVEAGAAQPRSQHTKPEGLHLRKDWCSLRRWRREQIVKKTARDGQKTGPPWGVITSTSRKGTNERTLRIWRPQ